MQGGADALRRSPSVRRLVGLVALVALLTASVLPWPISLVSWVLGGLGALVLLLIRSSPTPAEIRRHIPDQNTEFMTAWDVAAAAGMTPVDACKALMKDSVPRADASGVRARLPVSMLKLRYRRSEIERWLLESDRAGRPAK